MQLCYDRSEMNPSIFTGSRAELRSADSRGRLSLHSGARALDDDDDFEDEEIPLISGTGEGIMDETPATPAASGRRNEDIALDLMKFVAMTTGYGKTTSSGVGFGGTGSAAKPEEYAAHLLELYGKCLSSVSGKK